jgi:hypothetical protein
MHASIIRQWSKSTWTQQRSFRCVAAMPQEVTPGASSLLSATAHSLQYGLPQNVTIKGASRHRQALCRALPTSSTLCAYTFARHAPIPECHACSGMLPPHTSLVHCGASSTTGASSAGAAACAGGPRLPTGCTRDDLALPDRTLGEGMAPAAVLAAPGTCGERAHCLGKMRAVVVTDSDKHVRQRL